MIFHSQDDSGQVIQNSMVKKSPFQSPPTRNISWINHQLTIKHHLLVENQDRMERFPHHRALGLQAGRRALQLTALAKGHGSNRRKAVLNNLSHLKYLLSVLISYLISSHLISSNQCFVSSNLILSYLIVHPFCSTCFSSFCRSSLKPIIFDDPSPADSMSFLGFLVSIFF